MGSTRPDAGFVTASNRPILHRPRRRLFYDRRVRSTRFTTRLTRRSLLALAAAASLPAQEDGFEPLFNGTDLTGWEGDPFLWRVEDGELVGRTPGISYNDFLATNESFGDFILRFRIKLIDNKGNSGMQFRSQRVKGSMEMIGYQADVGPGYWGDLYDESRRRVSLVEADTKLVDRILKADDFNDYEVQAQGDHIVLKLNGKVTADYTEEQSDIPRDGRLAVQVHASTEPLEVRFKDIRIKKL